VNARFLLLAVGCVAASSPVRADEWLPNLTTTAHWHSNATLADVATDKVESLEVTADLVASERYAFARTSSLHLTAHLAGTWWPRYTGLTAGALGGKAELRHTFGTGTLAPTLFLEGAADAVAAEETGRRGVLGTITFGARKRLTAATRLTLSQHYELFDARYKPYDRAAGTTALAVDYDLSPRTRLTFSGRYRDGDVLTVATGFRPDLEAIATNRIETDAFDRAMTAYRVDAKTWSGRVAFLRALDDSSALVAAYEWNRIRREPLQVTDHVLSIGFVHQF
jgi:hypothetical protein